MKIIRRDFLRLASAAGASALFVPNRLFPGNSDFKTRVVVIEDEKACVNRKIDKNVVQIMIDEGIKALTGLTSPDDAWKSVFPGITYSGRISVKANCINAALPTHPEVVYAMVNSIKSMNLGGQPFNENNIIIYDRTTQELKGSKYTVNTSSAGIRCFGTDSTDVGYDTTDYDVSGSTERVTRIVTDMSDYLVNAAVLKNHYISGVTLCIKNHFGTVNNPNKLHPNNSAPSSAAISCIPVIRQKQCFYLIDALLGIISGGPFGQPQVNPNKIIMGTDIAAVDYTGMKLLESLGCTSTGTSTHIASAASLNLGTNKPDEIEIINIKNPSGSSGIIRENNETADNPDFTISYNQTTKTSVIRFYLNTESRVNFRLFDYQGRIVATLKDEVLSTGIHESTIDCSSYPRGIYFLVAKINSRIIKEKIII